MSNRVRKMRVLCMRAGLGTSNDMTEEAFQIRGRIAHLRTFLFDHKSPLSTYVEVETKPNAPVSLTVGLDLSAPDLSELQLQDCNWTTRR